MSDNLDPEVIRQLNDELAKFRDLVRNTSPSMMSSSDSANRSAKTLDDFVSSIRNSTIQSRASNEASKEEIEQKNQVKKVVKDAGSTFRKLGSTLLDTDVSMAKYQNALSGAGLTIQSATKLIFPAMTKLNVVVGLVTKTIEFLFKNVSELNDSLIRATDDLAQIGAVLPTEEFKTLANSALYGRDTFEKLTKVITGLGPDLLALGSTSRSGAEAFARLAANDDETLRRFRRIGVTQEKLNENQTQYIRLQALSGIQITERMKADGSLKKASLEYTENLIQLAALTGEDMETLKKRQEAQKNDIKFQLYMISLQDRELKAKEKQDQAAEQRFQQERKAAENLQALGLLLFKNQETLGSYNKMLVTGTLDGVMALINPKAAALVDQYKKTLDPEIFKELERSTLKGILTLGSTLQTTIGFNEEVAKDVSLYSADVINARRLTRLSDEEVQKERQKYLDGIKKSQKEGTDAVKDSQAAMESSNRSVAVAVDSLTSLVQGPVTKALTLFSETTQKVAKYLFGLFKNFPGFEKTAELELKFASFDELFEEQDEYKEKLANINSQIGYFRELNKPELAVNLEKQKAPLQARLDQVEKELQSRPFYGERKYERDAALREKGKKYDEERKAPPPGISRAVGSDFSMDLPDDGKAMFADRYSQFNQTLKELAAPPKGISSFFGPKKLQGSTGSVEPTLTPPNASSLQFSKTAREKSQVETLGSVINQFVSKLMSPAGKSSMFPGSDVIPAGTGPSVKQMLDYIAKYESEASGGYNAVNGSKTGIPNLTSMKLRDVKRLQRQWAALPSSSGAIGRYQFMPGTLGDAMEATGVTDEDVFNEQIQDRLGEWTLKRRGYFEWMAGNKKTRDFANELALEYAALPTPSGITAYPEQNKAGVGRNEFINFLEKNVRGFRMGGIADGPDSGFAAMLHGNELIKPLDPNSILEKLATTPATDTTQIQNQNTNIVNDNQATQVLSQIKEMQADFYDMMLNRLDNMVYGINQSNDIQDKILKYSMM